MGFITRNYRRPTFMWTYAALSWLVIIVGCRPLNFRKQPPTTADTVPIGHLTDQLIVTLTATGNLEYGDMVEVWCPHHKEVKPVVLTLIAASKRGWMKLGSLTCYFLNNTENGTGVFEPRSSTDATLCQYGLNSSTGIMLSTEDPLPELVLTGMIRVVGADVHPSNLPCYVIGEQPPTPADTVSISHSTDPQKVPLTTIGNLEYDNKVEVWCPYDKEVKPAVVTLIAASKIGWTERGSLTCNLLNNTEYGTGVFEHNPLKNSTLCQYKLNSSTGIALSTEDPSPELVLTGMLQIANGRESIIWPCFVVRRLKHLTERDDYTIPIIVVSIVICIVAGASIFCYVLRRAKLRKSKKGTSRFSALRRGKSETDSLLSSERNRWWDHMDEQQLHKKFVSAASKFAEKLSYQNTIELATILHSQGILHPSEFDTLRQVRWPTHAAEILIHSLIKRASTESCKGYSIFLNELLKMNLKDLVSLVTSPNQ